MEQFCKYNFYYDRKKAIPVRHRLSTILDKVVYNGSNNNSDYTCNGEFDC